MKLKVLSKKLLQSEDGARLWWYCASCDMLHPIALHNRPGESVDVWSWNNDAERPTFMPSFLTDMSGRNGPKRICHTYIKEGMVEYLNDSTIHLRGVTKELQDIPKEYIRDFVDQP